MIKLHFFSSVPTFIMTSEQQALYNIKSKKVILLDMSLLFLLLCILFLFNLGGYPLNVPDEARYCEIPREMLARHDFIVPYLNGLIYFEKPILMYWLQSLSITLFGLTEWSLRLVTASFGIIGILGTYLTASILLNRRAAWLASLILATSLLYFAMGHLISLDLPLTVLLSFSLYAFLIAMRYESPKRRYFMWGSYSFAALAVLTKGLIGIVFPMAIIGLWILLTNQWNILKRMSIPSGFLLFLTIVLPWHILSQIKNHDFFQFYFINQQFLRYLDKSVGHYKPLWYFIPIIVTGFFPWVPFLYQSITQAWNKHQEKLFFLIWAGFIFVFFSLSKSKLIPYILPVFPPLAFLVASYFDTHWEKPKMKNLTIGFNIILLLSTLIGLSLFFIPFLVKLADPMRGQQYLTAMGIISITMGFISYITFKKSTLKLAFSSLVAGMAILSILLTYAYPTFNNRSIKPLVLLLKPILKPSDKIIAYSHYYQDLPVYLHRKIIVVDWVNEFAFGLKHQPKQTWVINDKSFWSLWHNKERLFMFVRQKDYKKIKQKHSDLYLIGQTSRNVLVTNKKETL